MRSDDRQSDSDEAAPPKRSVGARLREQREALDKSIADVARDLRVDSQLIEEIEEEDFDALGPPVFAKGHLKNYSELLGLPTDELLAGYYELRSKPELPPLVRRKPPPSDWRKLKLWLATTLFALAIAGTLYWWFWLRLERVAPPVVRRPAVSLDAPTGQPQTPPEAITPIDPAALAIDSFDSDEVDSPGGIGIGANPQATVAPTVTATDGQMRLDIQFVEDCWTEVIDGASNRLYVDMARAGSRRTLLGEAPLQVLLGNAGGVVLRVNGEPFSVPAANRRGNLASFAITALEE